MRNYYFLIPHLQKIGKPTGHLEFEQEGEVEIFFVPIKSYVYDFSVKGHEGGEWSVGLLSSGSHNSYRAQLLFILKPFNLVLNVRISSSAC